MLIAQLTDTHVTVDGRQAGDLETAVAWLNALSPLPDLVLLTGDTVDRGSREQYTRLRTILARSAAPVYLVPGNHDERGALRATLPDVYYPGSGARINYVLDAAPLRIVALDTSDHRRVSGVLDDATLDWLDACLSAQPERPALAFMHHPPFRTGVNLADLVGFTGLRRFTGIVERHPQLRRIIAGHIHCERAATIGAALATTAMSTTPQRVPELFERRWLGLRPEPAGLTLHRWEHRAFTAATYVHDGAGGFALRPSLPEPHDPRG